jgi:hypothetical protein
MEVLGVASRRRLGGGASPWVGASPTPTQKGIWTAAMPCADPRPSLGVRLT